MAVERFLFEMPKPFQPPRVEKPRAGHTTYTGRVVYNRKRHFFTTKDVKRILKYLLQHDYGKKTDYADFLLEWGELELMLLDLLAAQGGVFGSNPLYDLIRDLVIELIKGKTEPPKPIK